MGTKMNIAVRTTVALSGSPDSRQPAIEDPTSNNLVRAALKGNTGRVIELLKAGANPDARDSQGRTPLIEAAFGGHTDTARALLEAGADPNVRDADSWTALMEATSKGRLDIVKRLIGAGADVNARNRDGRTALAMIARAHLEMARFIRRCGAER
jgi:ankyrin repeat protein